MSNLAYQLANAAEQAAERQRQKDKADAEQLRIAKDQNARASDAAKRADTEFKASQQNSARDTARRTAATDAILWDSPDTQGKAWHELPSYARQHFTDAYADIGGELPEAWNASQRAATGNQSIGLPQPQKGETISRDAKGGVSIHRTAPETTPIPSDIRSELVRLGGWREGMSLEEAQQARDDAYLKNGMIPEKYQKQASTIASQITHHPILAPFAKQKEAYDTMRAGFENPQSGGFGDMAMIEGFQRIVNPGAVVRQGTMNQMLQAAGLGQYGNWDFMVNKIKQGDKFTPETRQRLMDLADQTFNHAKQTAARELAAKQRLARMMGIPNAEQFVNNVLDFVAQEGQEAEGVSGPAAPGEDKFVVGRTYRDAQGNTATYRGNGKWE